MFLRASLGIIQPSNLTTLLSASIVENPICYQIVSELAMKKILRATGNSKWINALIDPATMDARISPRAAAEAVVEEETLI